tara:strand:- start:55 stop:333 length:279 start_codon:yes stop_codon:yes gene_type:complete
MPLIPPVINSAMDAAFVAGMEAMAAFSTGAEGTQKNSKDAVIAAGAAAFAGVAGPAITAYIKSATVVPGIPVVTAGSALAQTGATTGPGVIV